MGLSDSLAHKFCLLDDTCRRICTNIITLTTMFLDVQQYIQYHCHCHEVGFNADEAHNIVKECIDGVLGGEDYNQNNINQWTANIVEQSLTHVVKLGKAYKYIVTCAVVQRSAYGFHTASLCFWDTTSDGTCTVRWENRTMNCIVNVFTIAIVL
ncbi:PREDICTED: dynein light chain Tctex-type 3 [Odobenus rosmarus divergens]|uniref:Dynein light chain Tctex-type 3 n=1 Tax=Odobenus rosmarus divergens TaxID=9708 RepID=A0A2U3WBA4_ODORO|nr:PREDICTED: dynein light chain Tctex-type 3 [Odobenus rosmarus divergens]